MARFATMSRHRIECRFMGYLEHCHHPHSQDQVAKKVDVQEPFQIDFAVTDEPFEIPSIPDLVNFPIFVFGITPVYNLPGIPELVLSENVIARIFRGCNETDNPSCLPNSITTWGHPDIKALNPPSTHALLDSYGPIKVIVNLEFDFMTDGFKRACASMEDAFHHQMASS